MCCIDRIVYHLSLNPGGQDVVLSTTVMLCLPMLAKRSICSVASSGAKILNSTKLQLWLCPGSGRMSWWESRLTGSEELTDRGNE